MAAVWVIKARPEQTLSWVAGILGAPYVGGLG